MNIDLESIIAEKQNIIKNLDSRILAAQNQIQTLTGERETAQTELNAAIMLRDQAIARAREAEKATHQAWTISSASADILKKISTKKAHADQILLHFVEYGLAVSKATLTSQLAKDRHLFLPLGGNVFQLIESESSKPLPDFVAATTQNANRALEIIDNVPLGSKAINLLREIGQPNSTGEIKSSMVKRGLAEDNKNLFPWLHTALKRKEEKGEVILGEDKKWRLPEWIKVNEQQIEAMANEIQEQLALEQVSALQTENPTELTVGSQ